MKYEMKMLDNGNYERVVSPIQHQCLGNVLQCVEYSWDKNKLYLNIHDGDPCEDGYENKIEINFCPFCGYKPE